MDGATSSLLLTYGPLGLGVLGLSFVVNKLFDLYVKVQDLRISDKEALTLAVKNSTDAINVHTKAVEALTEIVKARR